MAWIPFEVSRHSQVAPDRVEPVPDKLGHLISVIPVQIDIEGPALEVPALQGLREPFFDQGDLFLFGAPAAGDDERQS